MNKNILFISFILSGIVFNNLNAQNYLEFKTELIKIHGKENTSIGDDVWTYYEDHIPIKKVELEIYSKEKIETYLVNMTWHLGWHSDDVNCLFTFDPLTKKIEFVGELWCEGFKNSFYKNLLNYSLPNESSVKKFVNDFEKLLQVNNPKVRFENIYLDKGQTVFFQTNYQDLKKKKRLERIVVLKHPKSELSSINFISPNTQTEEKIK